MNNVTMCDNDNNAECDIFTIIVFYLYLDVPFCHIQMMTIYNANITLLELYSN